MKAILCNYHEPSKIAEISRFQNYVTKGVYKQRVEKMARILQKVRSEKLRLCNDSRGQIAILRAGNSETGGYVTKLRYSYTLTRSGEHGESHRRK